MKFRRWKIWIVNIFDCFFSVQPMYHAQEVTWKTWTNDIKCLLLKSLFNEHSLNGNDLGPSHQSVSLIFKMYSNPPQLHYPQLCILILQLRYFDLGPKKTWVKLFSSFSPQLHYFLSPQLPYFLLFPPSYAETPMF